MFSSFNLDNWLLYLSLQIIDTSNFVFLNRIITIVKAMEHFYANLKISVNGLMLWMLQSELQCHNTSPT